MSTDSPEAHGQAVGSWHPDADATLVTAPTRCAGNGDQKPGAPGRPRSNRKTIAQGRPECSAEPVVPAACIFFCRRAMGAARTRPSLRLSLFGGVQLAKLGREQAPRERSRMSYDLNEPDAASATQAVIARLDRAIQYSRDASGSTNARGVLYHSPSRVMTPSLLKPS